MPDDAASTDLELLQRHAPLLRFDALECLRPTRVDAYVAGSIVRDGTGAPLPNDAPGLAKLARPGDRDWTLDPLDDGGDDGAEGRSDALLARYGAEEDPAAQGTAYGRVVRTSAAIFLQYWCFYVDNPCVLPPGRHDGDWELVQVRVSADGRELTHVTVAQHGGPETRKAAPGTIRPEVFVAVGSHASYLTRGTQPKLPLSDECDGEAQPAVAVAVEPMPAEGWSQWRGRWGIDRGPGTWLATRLHLPRTPWYLRWLNGLGAGDSPASPRWQHASWDSPGQFQLAGSAHRVTRVVLRDLLHWLGRLTWPRAQAAVTVTRVGPERATVSATAAGSLLRRVSRVAIRVEDAASGRPLAIHTVRAGEQPATLTLPVGAAIRWRAAGYNVLRQRGQVGEAELLPEAAIAAAAA